MFIITTINAQSYYKKKIFFGAYHFLLSHFQKIAIDFLSHHIPNISIFA